MSSTTEMAFEKACEILSSECTPIGLMASPEGYPHIRARDVHHKIRFVLWVGSENANEWSESCPGHTEWKHTLSQVDPVLVKRPFFLPYVARLSMVATS